MENKKWNWLASHEWWSCIPCQGISLILFNYYIYTEGYPEIHRYAHKVNAYEHLNFKIRNGKSEMAAL